MCVYGTCFYGGLWECLLCSWGFMELLLNYIILIDIYLRAKQ